jgi:aminoglycoside phosphotransferase (APT) family kinase protein
MATKFSSESMVAVLTEACRQVGLDPTGAELIRLGENAIFRLAMAPVVARIARGRDRLSTVERELCVARWLRDAGVPAVQVYEDVTQPIVVDGHPVSFWRAVTPEEPAPGHVELAQRLKQFHSAGEPGCELPDFDPLFQVKPRIAAARAVADEDLDFLSSWCEELYERYARLEFALPYGPIHGDAHVANLLRVDGQAVLLDFEVVARGPREWDLMPTSISTARFGLPRQVYRAFSNAYGFDVQEWPGYTVLRDVRELTMTTWLMQNVEEDRRIAEEFQRRVGSLRRRDLDLAWHAF